MALAYRGLDDAVRTTWIVFSQPAAFLGALGARFDLELDPQGTFEFSLSVSCGSPADPDEYDDAFSKSLDAVARGRHLQCLVTATNTQFNEWVRRSGADLQMMLTDLPEGPYPYAGVPWFSTPFGRDGIITALEMLWAYPHVARGVLRYLAAQQATGLDIASDAEPGKILHEARGGEMAALGEIPFSRYYGSVDATPLFIVLLGAYFRRTDDRELVEEVWPNVERALAWIDEYGDPDRDGFTEYARRSPNGLVHQGWKDSHDSVFHSDGRLADPPIALCEVQGYVYDARRHAADLATLLGHTTRAAHAPPASRRAARVAESLFDDRLFTGWGIRTLAGTEARFNPMSYHNGSVWPHDNALIAAGLARYGRTDLAARLLEVFFDASGSFDLRRMPELFCGFRRRPGVGPTRYPVACAPQSWAAAAVFMLLESCLGLRIDAPARRITFSHPVLPPFLDRVRIENLRVGTATLDLVLDRNLHDVGVSALRRAKDVEIVVLK